MGELRGLLFRIFAGVGLCCTTAFAFDQFLFKESFSSIPVDLQVDRRLDAYVPYYRRLLPLAQDSRAISPIDLRQIADDWIIATQAGKLEPIQTSFHGEDVTTSPKGQLIEVVKIIGSQLNRVAETEVDSGLLDDGVADAIRAAALIDSVRFASPTTMFSTAGIARQSIRIASTNISKVKILPAHLYRQVQQSQVSSSKYAEMLKRADHLKLLYTVRYGRYDAAQIEEYQDGRVNFGLRTSAQKFFGIDREQGLAKDAKACRFVLGSEVK